jgi:hypothetical protein
MCGTLKNWGLFVFGIACETYHERPLTVEISLAPPPLTLGFLSLRPGSSIVME